MSDPNPISLQIVASNVAEGSSTYGFAVELCRARAVDPFGWAPCNMPNWRAEIYRVLLETGLEILARNGQ